MIGPHRSGSSLVRSIIDSHPNILMAQELGRQGIYKQICDGDISREKCLNRIVKASLTNVTPKSDRLVVNPKTNKKVCKNYVHKIEDSFQGNATTLYIVGDKSGPWIGGLALKDPEFCKKLEAFFKVPVYYINTIRNPWDNIATMKIAGQTNQQYFKWKRGALEVKRQVDPEKFFDIHLEDLIKKPKYEITRMFRFLGLEIDKKLLNNCSNLVFDKPHERRKEIEWKFQEVDRIRRIIREYDDLSEYPIFPVGRGKEKKIFVIANGSSVSKLNLKKFIGTDTCMMNTSICYIDEFPFIPTYCVMNDGQLAKNKMIQSHVKKEEKLKRTKIFKTSNFSATGYKPKHSHCCDVLSVAIEILINKGYNHFVIFGLDFDYDFNKYEAGERVSGINQHYQINGKDLYEDVDVWRFPNLNCKLRSMKALSKFAEVEHIKIYNATLATKCGSFETDFKTYRKFYNEI